MLFPGKLDEQMPKSVRQIAQGKVTKTGGVFENTPCLKEKKIRTFFCARRFGVHGGWLPIAIVTGQKVHL